MIETTAPYVDWLKTMFPVEDVERKIHEGKIVVIEGVGKNE